LRPLSHLTDLPVREIQFKKIWVSVPVGCEDHCPSVWGEGAVQEVQVVADGAMLGKLMNDCAGLVIFQPLVFG
jgi:hypothetical protein